MQKQRCCKMRKHSKSYINIIANLQTGQRLCIQETKYVQKKPCDTLDNVITGVSFVRAPFPNQLKFWLGKFLNDKTQAIVLNCLMNLYMAKIALLRCMWCM